MEKKRPELTPRTCNYLLLKDGQPLCLFRIAETQPCGIAETFSCYYRGGPFNNAPDWQCHPQQAKKNE